MIQHVHENARYKNKWKIGIILLIFIENLIFVPRTKYYNNTAMLFLAALLIKM